MSEADRAAKCVCLCFTCTCLIVVIILVALSFSTLDATQMGLDYNSVAKTIDQSQLYGNGRHFLGVGHSFIVYPKEQRTISFPSDRFGILTARTSDGLSVDLEVSFQYRLKAELGNVIDLYYQWGQGGYEKAYAIIARNVLRDVASQFAAYDFFYNRTQVQSLMKRTLEIEIDKVHAVLMFLQLLDPRLPSKFNNKLQETEAMRQEIKKFENQLKNAMQQAQNRRNRADEEAQVIVQQKNATATILYNEKMQTYEQFVSIIDADIAAYEHMKSTAGFSGKSMASYMWLDNMKSNSYSKIHMKAPPGITCFADPTKSGCPMQPTLQYKCTSGSACWLKIKGDDLRSTDRIKLVSKNGQCTDAPVGVMGFTTSATAIASNDKLGIKAFALGAHTGEQTYKVCYCRYEASIDGCQGVVGDMSSYVDSGELIIS